MQEGSVNHGGVSCGVSVCRLAGCSLQGGDILQHRRHDTRLLEAGPGEGRRMFYIPYLHTEAKLQAFIVIGSRKEDLL